MLFYQKKKKVIVMSQVKYNIEKIQYLNHYLKWAINSKHRYSFFLWAIYKQNHSDVRLTFGLKSSIILKKRLYYTALIFNIKSSQEGWWDGWEGKGTCHQTWQPEFDSSDTHNRTRKFPQTVLLPPQVVSSHVYPNKYKKML